MNTLTKQIENEKAKYTQYLENYGLKLTNGRTIVFDEVICAHGHVAPEELVKQCKQNRRQISRATIYRCLRELLEAGVIRETALGAKHHHFEHLYDEKRHHHARCVRCGNHIEFPDLGEDKIYQPVLEKCGFQILGHEMHFYGICKDCQGK